MSVTGPFNDEADPSQGRGRSMLEHRDRASYRFQLSDR